MKTAEIRIETLPDDIQNEDDLELFKDGSELILYSGEILTGIDRVILDYVCTNIDLTSNDLCLILCTPGGDADSAYLTARKLNRLYENFSILVNGYCKSAGTLLALGANELFVTDEAEFGPLDVQIFSPDEFMKRSSGLTITQASKWVNNQIFEAFEDFFLELRKRSYGNITTKTAGEIAGQVVSTLYGRITDKIDPVVIGEMQRSVDIAIQYGKRLGVPTELINHLVKGYPSHGFVIDFEEAVALFPNCRLISDADSIMLFEIQKILYHEFDEDYTLMPHDNVFLAKITVDISEEERGEKNEENKEELNNCPEEKHENRDVQPYEQKTDS